MNSSLLATKLHRPRPTSSLVARPRLIDRLDEGLRNGHRLFLVVAPAGYGKTTLVADWLGRTGIPSAWLSLDEADNDPLRFFAYIMAADMGVAQAALVSVRNKSPFYNGQINFTGGMTVNNGEVVLNSANVG